MKRLKKHLHSSLTVALVLILCLLSGEMTIYGGSETVPLPDTREVLLPVQPEFPDETEGLGESAESEESAERDITLMAVGDNLLHMGIVNTGKQPDGTRNYDFLFEGISSFLACADIKMINQETIFGGNQLGFQGYPQFNSPSEVSDAITDAGFNVVLQATNHTADQGLKGMQNCIDLWKTHPEVLVAGLHEPFTEETMQNRIPLLEINGCTFAFLNYTYGPNSASVSASVSDRMDILCAVNGVNRMIDFTTLNPQVLTDIAEADALADIVVVCPHWGTEYATVPSSYQEKFAEQMTLAGADVIIGTHPHVVQPVTWIEAENGNRALCYYSLGNYVSTQKNGQSMLEGLAWVTFHVSGADISIVEEKTGIVPLVCHYSSGPVRFKKVYLLEDYTEELALSHGIIPYGGISFHLSSLQKWSSEILGGWVLPAGKILPQEQPD